jgi:DNA-binding NarL/FixJ family response regulator
MHGTREHIVRALKAGARGYLLKRSAGPELIDALQAMQEGRRYLSRHITEVLVDDYVEIAETVPDADPLSSLSRREREVLQLVAEGHHNQTIAHKLKLSPKTVHTYRSRIMTKLDLHDAAGLVRFAFQHNLTPEE